MTRRLGMGLVGPGFVGAHHVDAVRRLGFVDVVALCDVTEAQAAAKAAALGVPKAYGSVEALAADPAIHVIHVTTPNAQHAHAVRAALAAGKHVLCEKPLAMSSDEALSLWRAARDAGVVHAVMFNRRIDAVLADLTTVVPVRQRPRTSREAFAGGDGSPTGDYAVRSEDLASVLLRFEGGAKGCVSVGQVCAGHKNDCWFELSGAAGSVRWRQEQQNELWVGEAASGERDRPQGSGAALAARAALRPPARRSSGGLARCLRQRLPRRLQCGAERRGAGGRAMRLGDGQLRGWLSCVVRRGRSAGQPPPGWRVDRRVVVRSTR